MSAHHSDADDRMVDDILRAHALEIADLTDERDRARRWAVHLENENRQLLERLGDAA